MLDKCWNARGGQWAGANNSRNEQAKGLNNFYFSALGLATTGDDCNRSTGVNTPRPASSFGAAEKPENQAKAFISTDKAGWISGHNHVGLHYVFDMNKVMGELAPVTFVSGLLGEKKPLAVRLVDASFGIGMDLRDSVAEAWHTGEHQCPDERECEKMSGFLTKRIDGDEFKIGTVRANDDQWNVFHNPFFSSTRDKNWTLEQALAVAGVFRSPDTDRTSGGGK
jgi:hypothetical protein